MDKNLVRMKEGFDKVFDGGDAYGFFAPGRVNLIGEHTDYNGGHVFPCALTIGTYAIARLRDDRMLRFYSENFADEGIYESSLDNIAYDKKNGWTNYCLGVIDIFIKQGYAIDRGVDFYCFGDIPSGAGLSSSASLEVLTGKVLKELFNIDIDMISVARIGQSAENDFVGMNCGIMDQFASAMGKKDSAIFLDTSDLSYEYAPIALDGYKIVIANTNKPHKLTDSKYNERRSECEEALDQIRKDAAVNSLGELDEAGFEGLKKLIKRDVCIKRARHAVFENLRTIEAVMALKAGDLVKFGKLMNESHVSLRDDYEVTGVELDTLALLAWNQEGVLGSRMTGAGFGGCTVSLVKDECLDSFIENVGKEYYDKIGYAAAFYVVEIGDGPVAFGRV